MKKALVDCVENMVKLQFGDAKWQICCNRLGVTTFDELELSKPASVVDIVSVCAEVIGLDKRNFFAHLGAFWSKDFAPKYFKSWFIMAMSAKEFAKQLDRIYAILHDPNSNSEKTHIQYNWLDSDTLRLEYQMDADYLELFEALARGIATYYKPDIRIEKHQNSVTIFHFE